MYYYKNNIVLTENIFCQSDPSKIKMEERETLRNDTKHLQNPAGTEGQSPVQEIIVVRLTIHPCQAHASIMRSRTGWLYQVIHAKHVAQPLNRNTWVFRAFLLRTFYVGYRPFTSNPIYSNF